VVAMLHYEPVLIIECNIRLDSIERSGDVQNKAILEKIPKYSLKDTFKH
jgi:hypothetical protein